MEEVMRPIIDTLDTQLIFALVQKRELAHIHEILLLYKKHGVSAAQVTSLLTEMRTSITDGSIEDKILEAMDLTSNFCSPHVKVW
jgi:hypothetical protein